MRRKLCAPFVAFTILLCGQLVHAQNARSFTSLDDFAKWVNSRIPKVPFERDSARYGSKVGVRPTLSTAPAAKAGAAATTHNVKVNRDRNPWPKAELAIAVDPTNGQNLVVMTNDFRENWDHEFYHVSTNGGTGWSDDSMVGGNDPFTGFTQLTFQSDPGVASDRRAEPMGVWKTMRLVLACRSPLRSGLGVVERIRSSLP